MDKFKDFLFSEKEKKYNRLGMKRRILLIPLSFVSWLVQLIVFSIFFGYVSIIIGTIAIVSSAFQKDKNEFNFGLFFLIAPAFCPIAWWVRYFKFGEYGILID